VDVGLATNLPHTTWDERIRECTGTGFQARSLVKLLTGFPPARSFK
jgi:hypothetical protein